MKELDQNDLIQPALPLVEFQVNGSKFLAYYLGEFDSKYWHGLVVDRDYPYFKAEAAFSLKDSPPRLTDEDQEYCNQVLAYQVGGRLYSGDILQTVILTNSYGC